MTGEDLSLIEFDTSGRSLARRIGFGFHYRPNGNEEHLSVKNWLSEIDSAELMIGYSSGSVSTFGVELRYARVFKVEGTSDLFYGAGTGIISKDSTRGTSFRFFSGSEFFPSSSPNFGISLEFGVLRQQGVGDDTQGFYNCNISTLLFLIAGQYGQKGSTSSSLSLKNLISMIL